MGVAQRCVAQAEGVPLIIIVMVLTMIMIVMLTMIMTSDHHGDGELVTIPTTTVSPSSR